MWAALRTAGVTNAAACASYLTVLLLLAVVARLKFGPLASANSLAIAAFILSATGLCLFGRSLSRSHSFAGRAALHGEIFPRHLLWVAAALATAWVLATLPPTYRATQSVREVMVFWHDEGITLEQLYRFVKTPGSTPEYRLLQGWITFLPVALLAKAINAVVPVEMGTLNLMMRHYYLIICWGIVFSTSLLGFLLTRSVILAALMAFVALWRPEIYILLAIDRPDGFQLLFVVLSLISLVLYCRREDSGSFFATLVFAGLAFAAKYSGHLLLSAIGIAWLSHRWQAHKEEKAATLARSMAGEAAAFVVCAAVIFVLTFFLASPYHLPNFWAFVGQILYYLPVYAAGNIYNVPDYNPPASALLWWRLLSSRGMPDSWLLIASGIGLLACGILALRAMRSSRRVEPEVFLLIWFATYAVFLVRTYGGDLVEYRYVFPILPLFGFFAVYPVVLLLRPLPSVGSAAVVALLCAVIAGPAWKQARNGFTYLAHFRLTEGPRFEIGRYLDRRVAPGESPRVLMTNLAYVPDRIERVTVANVSVTLALLDKEKYDYVIMTQNMYDIYAGKPTNAGTNKFYGGYNVYYNDVVAAYTAFKQRSHPDYGLLAAFDGWELFERVR